MKRSSLTALEIGWARDVLGTIFPPEPEAGFPIGIAEMDVGGFLTRFREDSPAFAAFGIRFAIVFVALSPLLAVGRVSTLSGLAPEARERVMLALSQSHFYFVRQIVMVLKATGALLYAAHPEIRARCYRANEVPAPPISDVQLISLGTGARGDKRKDAA